MKKKSLVFLLSSMTIASSAIIAVPLINSNKVIEQNISKNVSTNNQFQKLNSINDLNISLDQVNQDTNQFKLTINNYETEYGSVRFLDGTTVTMASPGDLVILKSVINNNDYVISSVDVFDAENPSIALAVDKNENQFSFIMPEIESQFYISGCLNIDINYQLEKVNKWIYNFVTKTYDFIITEDNYIYDDQVNPELQMIPQNDYTNYRIYLMSHNLIIKNLTVPKYCDLGFINNINDSNDAKKPIVSLMKGATFNINGVIGRWRSVEFSQEINTILGYW